jgi:hypothetical protein
MNSTKQFGRVKSNSNELTAILFLKSLKRIINTRKLLLGVLLAVVVALN